MPNEQSSLKIHNVYFMKSQFTQAQAEAWIKAHGYKLKKKDQDKGQLEHGGTPRSPDRVGTTQSTEWRYNQVPKQKFKSFVTKILPNGVHLILGERIKPTSMKPH